MRTLTILAALLAAVCLPAQAIKITSVTAPNLQRPKDNLLYSFDITVNGTYDGIDIRNALGTSFDAEYWDADLVFDDPIDGYIAHTPSALNIPAPGPGDVAGVTLWGPITLSFQVGCTTAGIVFGPKGSTGEGPVMDDGYFYFRDTGNPAWGYNTVTCIATVPTPINPPPPWPPLTAVPEPAGLLLWAAGLAGLWTRRRRLLQR